MLTVLCKYHLSIFSTLYGVRSRFDASKHRSVCLILESEVSSMPGIYSQVLSCILDASSLSRKLRHVQVSKTTRRTTVWSNTLVSCKIFASFQNILELGSLVEALLLLLLKVSKIHALPMSGVLIHIQLWIKRDFISTQLTPRVLRLVQSCHFALYLALISI